MRRVTFLAVGLLIGTLYAPITSARGDSATALFTGYPSGGIVVDAVHDRVFVASESGTLIVTDLDGVKTATLSLGSRPSELELSVDGERLWITLPSEFSIAEVDVTTLAVTKHPTGSWCPLDVAEAAGVVWFTGAPNECRDPIQTAALSPTSGQITQVLGPDAPETQRKKITVAKQFPDTLFVVTADSYSSQVASYQASGGTNPTLTDPKFAAARQGGYVGDFGPTASGDRVGLVAASDYVEYDEFLNQRTRIEPSLNPNYLSGFAERPDGLLAIGQGYDVVAYRRTGSTTSEQVNRIDIPSNGSAAPSGMQFAAGRLYVSSYHSTGRSTLQILTIKNASRLKVRTDKQKYKRNGTATITATLVGGTGKRVVRIYATPAGQRKRLIHKGAVNAKGVVRTTFTMERGTRFDATWNGSATFDATSDDWKAFIRTRIRSRLVGYQRKVGKYAIYRPGTGFTIAAQVLPSRPGRCVRVAAQKRTADGVETYVSRRCLPLNRRGETRLRLSSKNLIGGNVRVQVAYGGGAGEAESSGKWHYSRFVR